MCTNNDCFYLGYGVKCMRCVHYNIENASDFYTVEPLGRNLYDMGELEIKNQ